MKSLCCVCVYLYVYECVLCVVCVVCMCCVRVCRMLAYMAESVISHRAGLFPLNSSLWAGWG